MKFSTLQVEIIRHEHSRRLSAFVVQRSAQGEQRGVNVLRRRNLRLIASAEQAVQSAFLDRVGHIDFIIKAAPDLVRQGRPDILRHARQALQEPSGEGRL